MNEYILSTIISSILSGFLWKVDLICPMTFVFDAKVCSWMGCGGMARICCGEYEVIINFFIIITFSTLVQKFSCNACKYRFMEVFGVMVVEVSKASSTI